MALPSRAPSLGCPGDDASPGRGVAALVAPDRGLIRNAPAVPVLFPRGCQPKGLKMTDIVERLRRTASLGITNSRLMDEAADEIERLRAEQGTEDDMANEETANVEAQTRSTKQKVGR